MNRIVGIPEIPDGTPEPLAGILRALKQNVEVLTGLTGDRTERAVKFGDVLVADTVQRSADAAGDPPTQAEFNLAVADIAELNRGYNYLAALLRGEDVGA